MALTSSQADYDAFLEKVKRTIYVDNLSSHVTEKVMEAAFGQFGAVASIRFIPNLFEQNNMPVAALVEMETPKQAEGIISQMKQFPFMILGKPRPVRSRPATAAMFEDRPRKPARRIVCRWVSPEEPEFEMAKKMKHLVRKQEAEASLVLKYQREEEEKLASQQNETLKAHYKKLELLEGVFQDGTAQKLAHQYKVPIADA